MESRLMSSKSEPGTSISDFEPKEASLTIASTSISVARVSPLPVLIYTSPLLFIATGRCGDKGISKTRTHFSSMLYLRALHKIGALNFVRERNVVTISCSICSGFGTPLTINSEPSPVFFSFAPRTIQPPAVLEKALTVSHMDLGRPPEASLTSKSFHSISLSLASSSSFVIFTRIRL